MQLPPQVKTALTLLEDAGFEAFLVGGAVRDHIRCGGQAQDWDITTNALPAEVESVFADFRLIETGLKHGTVTVLIDRTPMEITTYRIDGAYSDHRRPDAVRFTRSLQEDLARRDFTMNALAYNPKTGIVDPFGGLEDIAAGLVRCVGMPDRRFQEDGLRILRAIRFASVFGMQIEAGTAGAIHRNRELLRAISAERIQVELTKLLCGAAAGSMLTEFADVIAVPIPELAPTFGFHQQNPHHDKDIWAHTITVVAAAPATAVLRWAALLHDIGKPPCFSLDTDGIGHFYGHAEKSAELADTILRRLRLDTASRRQIMELIQYHDLPLIAEKKPLKRLLNKLGPDGLRRLIALHRADTCGQASICQSRLETYRQAELVLDGILQEAACFCLKDLAVNGNDMLAIGLQGKQVGAALQDCLNAVMDERTPNDRDALLALVRDQYRRPLQN